MENSGFKYYKKILAGTFRAAKPWHIVFAILMWVVAFNGFHGLDPKRIVVGAVCGVIFWVLWFLIGALVITLKQLKLYKVLDQYGYGMEFLRAYENERITGKPFRLQYAAEYALIFARMGQPADAVTYLDSVAIPSNAPVHEKIHFFFAYVVSALKADNLAAAENKWREFQELINKAQNDPVYNESSYMLYLALIYIDCYAGRQGDLSRVRRAYDQTVAYMNTGHYKRYPLPTPDFEIVMLLELKLLGRTDEFNALYPRVRQKVETWDPLLLVQKKVVFEDLEKVCRGELPL
ncbi:MAG: hypothetical protein K2N38_11345 [Oscillospiraceae bacterium]|nr:hypothetical protein [Oscillospiraceae bacterium]